MPITEVKLQKRKTYFILLLPTILAVTVLIIIPLLTVVVLSLTNFSLIAPKKLRIIWLSNYSWLLSCTARPRA